MRRATSFVILLSLLFFSFGCTGVPGMLATQIGAMAISAGSQRLANDIFGPPAYMQTPAMPTTVSDCRKTNDGETICRYYQESSTPRLADATVKTPPALEAETPQRDNSRKVKDGRGCEWTPENGGTWNCPKEIR